MIKLANSNAIGRVSGHCRVYLRAACLGALSLLIACATPGGSQVPLGERADIRIDPEPMPVTPNIAPLASVLAAELASARGDNELASDLYESVINDDADAALVSRSAEVALLAGHPERALRRAMRWAELEPQSLEASQLVGILQLGQGQVEASINTLLESLPTDPSLRETAMARVGGLLLDQTLRDGSMQVMQALAAALPDSNAAQLSLARLALVRDDPDTALDAVARVLDRDPEWISARLLRVDALLATGQAPQALDEFETILTQAPGNQSLRQDYARTLLQLGRDEEAFAQYRRLVADGAIDPQLLSTAAILAIEQDEAEFAFMALARLRERHPDFAARSFLLEAGLLRSLGQLEQSLQIYDRALVRYPDDSDLLYGRAMTQVMRDDIDAAIADLEQILRSTPDDARTLNALGYTLVDRTAQIEKGTQLIQRAYALEPEDPAIIDSMGWAAFRSGDPEQALEFLRKAHQALPADGEIAAHLGEVLWVLGRQQEARAVWDAALESDPSHPVLEETLERLDP